MCLRGPAAAAVAARPGPRHAPRADGRGDHRRDPARGRRRGARRAAPSLVCAAVLAGQASIGWSNDWLDADRDRAVARGRQAGRPGRREPRDAADGGAGAAAASPSSCRSLLGARARGSCCWCWSASGWAYNAGLKRTAASVLPYVTGFGALPAGVVAAAPGTPIAPVVAGRGRRRARRGGAPGQRRPRPRGRPGDRGARACRTGSGARPPRCSAPLLLGGASLRPGARAARPADGGGLGRAGASRCPPWWSPRSPARARFRRLAFPAVMLLTVRRRRAAARRRGRASADRGPAGRISRARGPAVSPPPWPLAVAVAAVAPSPPVVGCWPWSAPSVVGVARVVERRTSVGAAVAGGGGGRRPCCGRRCARAPSC